MPRFQHPLTPARDRSAAAAALVLGLALLAAPPAGAAGQEVFLRYGGSGGDYERVGIGLRLRPVWSADWGSWHAQLRPEFELSHFRYSGPPPQPDGLEQGGIVAHLRVQRGSEGWRPYGEVGLGLSLFSNDQLGTKTFSTHFQFSQHLGLGIDFAGSGFAGYQYSHYSNADIDEPNHGVDLHQAVAGLRF